MKILIWAPQGMGEHYSGPGISTYRLYRSYQEEGVDVFLAHGSKHQKVYPQIFKQQYFIAKIDNVTRKNQILFLLKSFFWILRNAKKFDVVHVLGLYEISFRPAIWFEKRGVKVFCKLTGAKGGLKENSRLSRMLGISNNRKANLNKLTGFVANSTDIIKTLKMFDVEDARIHHIPNGVDTRYFFPPSENEKKALRNKYQLNDIYTVVFVGGISQRKRPFMLVEALKQLKEMGIEVQLVMVGPDRSGKEHELERIKNFIKANNLEPYFYHFDHTTKPVEFYQLADVYSLPSESEGMSNALLEAMACGLPCVVTPVSGSVDLISSGWNGFIHEDLEGLTEALKVYGEDEGLRKKHAENTLGRIQQEYRSEALLKRHFEIFKRLGQ